MYSHQLSHPINLQAAPPNFPDLSLHLSEYNSARSEDALPLIQFLRLQYSSVRKDGLLLLPGRRHEPGAPVGKKLEVIRAAVRHDFPSADIDTMLAEIESGYGSGTHP